MSENDPIDALDLKQDRRQWLKTSATALGATLIPMPGVSTQTLQTESKPAASAAKAKSAGRFFTPLQHATLDELSETIIPADSHSGGAKAAKVADYIEQVVGQSIDESQKALWREGL